MSTTPTTKPNRPSKMEFEQAKVRLRRRLEDSLEEIPYQNGAERRFVGAMIDLLYCLPDFMVGSNEVLDSLRKLTRKGQLRFIFSRTRSETTEQGLLVVRVESPGNRI